MEVVGTPTGALQGFRWVRDIEWFEGPLLSEFECNGQTYAVAWRDRDDAQHRWLVLPVRPEDLLTYEAGLISLLELFKLAEDAYLLDTPGSIDKATWYRVRVDELPAGYFPQPTAYYDAELAAPKGCAR